MYDKSHWSMNLCHIQYFLSTYLIGLSLLFDFVCRAADWDLANPSWKGRLKVLSKGNSCTVRLEDRSGKCCFGVCVSHSLKQGCFSVPNKTLAKSQKSTHCCMFMATNKCRKNISFPKNLLFNNEAEKLFFLCVCENHNIDCGLL